MKASLYLPRNSRQQTSVLRRTCAVIRVATILAGGNPYSSTKTGTEMRTAVPHSSKSSRINTIIPSPSQ
ncbi:hypothetical protein DPMN_055973 [Dreissena polymorpha]|uniref:Uncharacterized protein n=1 Tax=Dreissena polymorpha TaxID=45954 RepID=A0A9D4CQW3_DREPO|nr:hypothetical protein DPMN_055973 [Dreissena polymorpha]